MSYKMSLGRLATTLLLLLLQNGASFAPQSPQLQSPQLHPPTTTTTTLHAIPSWTYYSLAHIVGGTSGTPIVISGTKPNSWFDRIPKPKINPPNFIFGPVWTLLYGLMGVSVSRIIAAGSTRGAAVLKLWYAHYALNLAWAPVFFGLQRFRLGFVISSLLVLTLGGILPLYHAIDPLAAYLQLPYLGWLMFATVLNYQFCVLNPVDENGVNEAMRQKKLVKGEYTEERLKSDIEALQRAAAEYAGL